MYVRLARREDLSAAADICTSANSQAGEATYVFCWPPPGEKVGQLHREFLHKFRRRFIQPSGYVVVCVEPNGDHEEVLGYAVWIRHNAPPGSPHNSRNTSLLSAFERRLLKVEDVYRSSPLGRHVYNAANREHLAMFENLVKDDKTFEPLTKKKEGFWEIGSLAVSPKHQRRGIGSKVVEWGTQRATEEGVPAIVMASKVGIHLYKRHGFVLVDWASAKELLGRINNGPAMIFDPERKFVEPAPEDDNTAQTGDKVDVHWNDEYRIVHAATG